MNVAKNILLQKQASEEYSLYLIQIQETTFVIINFYKQSLEEVFLDVAFR